MVITRVKISETEIADNMCMYLVLIYSLTENMPVV